MPELEASFSWDGPTAEKIEVPKEETAFPSISELTSNERFQNLTDVRKAYTLGKYRNKLARHLYEVGEVINKEQLYVALERVDKTIDKHMPSGNSINAMVSSLVDRREIISEMTGLRQTMYTQKRIEDFKNFINQANLHSKMDGIPNEDIKIPHSNEIESYIKKFDEIYQGMESLRTDMEASLENDKDIQGRDAILGQGVSASTFAQAGSRMVVDMPMAAGSFMVAGPAGPAAYYSLVSSARSDRTLRLSRPEMQVAERGNRSAITGLASGSLEAIGFGFLTNGKRALEITKAFKNVAPEFARRIGGAALAEATTEFMQTYVEHFGHNVEALDDFITIMSDKDVAKEALQAGAVGGILGSGVRGGIEISMPAVEKIIQTDAYKNARKKIHEKLEKIDFSKRVREPISDLAESILKTQSIINEESKNLEELEIKRDAGQIVGEAIAEDATKRDLPTPEEGGFGIEIDGRFEKSDILSASEAREQGESSAVQESDIEGKDFIPKNNALPIEKIIRDSILQNGGIDIRKSSFFKDNLQDSDSNPLFSPKFRATKETVGLPLDEHIEVLHEITGGMIPRDINPDLIIQALNGDVKDLKALQNSQPTLEDLETMVEENPNEDFETEVDIELFDMQPSKKSQKSAIAPVSNVPEQSLASETSHTSLFDETPKEIKVDELPLSLSDLTKMSSHLIDNPTVIKKLVGRNPAINGVYKQGQGIELKAGLAAGPEIKVYPRKVAKETVIEEVMTDEDIMAQYPDLTADDIIVRDNGIGGVSAHKRDHDYAARTFAHEIGHLIDDIDAKDLDENGNLGLGKRGNLLGRLQGIKKFYEREVLTNDGQIKNKIVKAELKKLTQYWKPFDVNADKKYTRYRHSGPELYADAISVMFNKPGLLASMAPQFYKGLKTFMKNKPEVQASYDALQDARKKGDSAKNNLDDVINMMKDAGALKEMDAPEGIVSKVKGLFRTLRGEAINTRAEHINYKKQKSISDKVWNKFEDAHLDFLHSSGMASGYLAMQRNFLQEMKDSGISQAEFDAFMFLQLTANERADFFNPLGLRGKESIDTLNELNKSMGEKYNKLPELQKKFNQARKVAKDTIVKSGIFNEALTTKILENKNYVSFDVVGDEITKNFSDRGSAKIMKVVGTLKELKKSPFEKTVHQDMALMHLAYLNTAKKTLVTDLVLPKDRVEAETNSPGGLKKFRGKDQELVTYLEDGKLQGYYIDKNLAQLYDGNVRGAAIIKYSSIAMSPVKALWVKFSPAFALRNTPRDFAMGWKQLGPTFQKVPTPLRPFVQGITLAKEYIKTAPEVFKSAYLGKHSKYIVDMELSGEIHLADPGGVGLNEDYDSQAERMFAEKLGEVAKDQSIFKKALNAIPNTGKFTELWTRRAGKAVLEKHSNLSKKEITRLLRHFGSPDFLDGGYQKRLMNSIFVFSNANLMGLRQNFEVATKNPVDFMFKTALWNVLPATIAYMAIKGLLGDDAEEFYGKVDELDIPHSLIIPLGVGEDGKAKYIRIAQDHFGSMFGQMAWGILNEREDEIFEAVKSQIPFDGENVNPMLRIGFETLAMASGKSPTDHYNRQVVDKNIIGTEEGWKDFGRYQWNSVLSQQLKLDTKNDSGFSNVPFVTSLSKALYRETSNGEIQRDIRNYVEKSQERGGYIASYVSDLKNDLTEAEVKREAMKAYFKYPDKKKSNRGSFLRSFLLRYKKVKSLKR